MSEIDRQVAALDSMDKDELRTACEEQLFEIEVLKTDLEVMKIAASIFSIHLYYSLKTDLEVMKKQNTLLKEEIKSIKEGVKD
jgi:hypothetical protein